MLALASASPSSLWFFTRGTGIVALLLLTLTVALGVANVRRMRTTRVPRFVVDAIHRNAALLSVTFLAAHIATTLLDGYVPIRLIDTVIPFGSAYQPLWLGLGAISLDLMFAVVVTSLLRRRLGYRAWRATHWLAYASWPVALVHSLGMGTDRHAQWMLALAGLSILTVLAAVAVRITGGGSDDTRVPAPRRPERRPTPVLATGRAGR